MEQIKVTIILPIYNCKRYVAKAIDSVVKQTYKNWELIIIDDNSTDGIKSILKKYETNNKIKIHYNNKNMGCYWCLNYGIQNSDGAYISRIDSDDEYLPNKIRFQTNILNKNTNILGVFVSSKITNNDAVMKSSMAPFMMRRDIINEIGYYDSVRFGADLEYKRRMFKVCGKDKFRMCDRVLYNILKRPASLTRAPNSKMHSVPRNKYNESFNKWHRSGAKLYMEFPLNKRLFNVHKLLLI